MERLNDYAAKFLYHIKVIPEKKVASYRKGSSEHIPFIDWSDKIAPNPILEKELNHDHSTLKIYKIIDGIKYGFDDSVYPHFIKFINHLSLIHAFASQASEEFILEETFSWLIDSFIAKRINLQLIPYLQNRIEELTEIRTYHFPVLNLHIDEPFEIGNCKFQYFTKNDFDLYWDQLKTKQATKKEFDELFRKYTGRVFITTTVKGEERKSEEIAFAQAGLAMDVFRLHSPAVLIPAAVFKVDLEKRININYSSDYLVETYKDERVIGITMSAHNEPFDFNNRLYELVMSNGLEVFSDFINSPKQDDLYNLILHSISFYSFALSISDLHLRVSQLIMIIEGLLLEEGWVTKLQEKTKKRLTVLMFAKGSKEYLILNGVMNSMYKVRHAITHKGIRLPIDKNKLRDFQITLVEFLRKLILLNQRIRNKADLISYIETL